MAYCIIYLGNKEDRKFIIEDWNLLNLMDKDERITEYCTNSLENKKKGNKETQNKKQKKDKNKQKNIVRLENFLVGSKESKESEIKQSESINIKSKCGRLAKYKKSGEFFCEKCAKIQSQYLLPKKNFQSSSLKKMKVDDLKQLYSEYIIQEEEKNNEKPLIKKDYIEGLERFFKEKCLESILETKTKTAGQTDLITIGKNMKLLLNQVPNIDSITKVLIENQISSIATRMKSIQGMLAQYFIMRNTDTDIEFISSSNKLKEYKAEETKENKEIKEIQQKNESNESKEKEIKGPNEKLKKETQQKQNYKKNKNDGKIATLNILENTEELKKWIPYFNECKKKDDLADAFLQGLWYLKK
jgi:hypothetical protein